MTRTTDVVVVGCGAIGASCAFQLVELGLRVLVVERLEAPAMGSTGRSAAGVRVQFTTRSNVLLSKESIDIYRTFEERYGHDVGYRPIGYLLLVPSEAWPLHLEAVALQHELDVPVDVLDLDEAQGLVAFDPAGLGGATFGPSDGVVDPHWVTHAFVRMARTRGASFLFDRDVVAVERLASGSGWRLSLGDESVETAVVVNAAGAWSAQVASLAGLRLPVQPMRNMIFSSEAISSGRAHPMTIDTKTGFYLRSEGEKLLLGRNDPDEPRGFTTGMNWPWLASVLEHGVSRFPWLEQVGIDYRGSWWGYYAETPDHNPIIGRHPGVAGWIDATGFSGHGLMHAPATGRIVAELVAGQTTSHAIEDYRHDRFRERDEAGALASKDRAGDRHIF